MDEFHEEDKLLENYKKIIKPYSNKMEALGRVRDGSTEKI